MPTKQLMSETDHIGEESRTIVVQAGMILDLRLDVPSMMYGCKIFQLRRERRVNPGELFRILKACESNTTCELLLRA